MTGMSVAQAPSTPEAPQAPCLTHAVAVLEGGTSPERCPWDTEVPTSGQVGYCGAIGLGWSGWGVPMAAVPRALSPHKVSQSCSQDVLAWEVEPTLK